jgi:uncharacterized protein (TIGR02466 family)
MEHNSIHMWFPTAVLCSEKVLFSKLNSFEDEIYRLCENNTETNVWSNSYVISTYWHNINGNLQNNPVFDSLKNVILTKAKFFAKKLGYSNQSADALDIANMWGNIIKEHHYHGFHTHSDTGSSIISGVYYVKAPDNACINFRSPYHNSHAFYVPESPTSLSSKITSYKCSPGTLLMWQSFIEHGYDSHRNKDHDKISIPFNLIIKK